MPLELMIAMILVLPVIVLFAAFVLYLNISRIFAPVKEDRQDSKDAGEKRPAIDRF